MASEPRSESFQILYDFAQEKGLIEGETENGERGSKNSK